MTPWVSVALGTARGPIVANGNVVCPCFRTRRGEVIIVSNQEMSSAGRRPLKVRGARWAAATARWLTRRGCRPNVISVMSVVFAASAGVLFIVTAGVTSVAGRSACLLAAAAAIQLRLLCNLFDGMVAVEGGLASKSGEIYNELPDRISDLIIFVGAGSLCGDKIWALQLGWAAGALSVLAAYVRALGVATGAGQQFVGPMAKPQRMAVLTVSCVIGAALSGRVAIETVMMLTLLLIVAGALVTVIRRTWRICRTLEAG